MASREENERQVEGVVVPALKRWLQAARDAVMAPWRQYKLQPDPSAIYRTQPMWDDEVSSIMTVLGRIGEAAWNEAAGTPSVSRHAFVMAQLAQTPNFLARVPDETANRIFAAITDTINGGGDVAAVASAVDKELGWTGTENWPNRAHVIAVTETTRAMNAGVQGAAGEMSRVTGRILSKEWRTEHDDRVRPEHRAADSQTVPFHQPFMVGGEALMFPGDPFGSPWNVINCRCDLIVKNEVA